MVRFLSFLLLCLIACLNITRSVASSVPCNVTSSGEIKSKWRENPEADKSEPGFRLFNHVFRKIKVYALHQCSFYCLRDSRCKSYNYVSKSQLCELNSADRSMPLPEDWVQFEGKWLPTIDKLTRFAGSRYYSKQAYTIFDEKNSDVDFGPCSKEGQCPADHICSPSFKSSKSFACIPVKLSLSDIFKSWLPWSLWTSCSKTCGYAMRKRTRQCSDLDHPWSCPGLEHGHQLCAFVECPQWSQWGPWGKCGPQLCGTGSKRRHRTCQHGVLPDEQSCPGNAEDTLSCRLLSCTATLRLSSGTEGQVLVLDDTKKYEPLWRGLCKPSNSTARKAAEAKVCRSLNMASMVHSGDHSWQTSEAAVELDKCDLDDLDLMSCTTGTLNETCTAALYAKCISVVSSCESVGVKRRLSAFYNILPREDLPPFRVFCNYTQGIMTSLHHNTTSEVLLDGKCDANRCFRYNIGYFNSLQQIDAVIADSSSCRQYFKVRCLGVMLQLGAWIDRNGIEHTNWGTDNDDTCPCGLTGTCVRPDRLCNCFSNYSAMYADEGFITDKNLLPIIGGLFGDLGVVSESAWLTVGPLECFA